MTNFSLGQLRYQTEMRQVGALLMAFSALVTMNSLTDTVGIVAGSSTPSSGMPLYNLIASLALSVVGITGTIMGYMTSVQERGWEKFSLSSIALTQLAWLPFLGGLVAVGMGSKADPERNPFVPAIFNPTSTDVKLVGAMGVLSILAYASSFVGAVGFTQFLIYRFQSGKAEEYVSSYYRGRSLYYNFLVFVAGVAQLLLGAYILGRFGGGPLTQPIGAGPIVVTYPEISVFVGLIQLMVGFIGMLRRFGITGSSLHTYYYQSLCLFMWICMLSMQILVQVGYPAGADLVPAAPTLGCLYFALSFVPAYLDHKASTSPDSFPPGYFESSSNNRDDKTEIAEDKV